MNPAIIVFIIFICFCLFMIYYTSHQISKSKKYIAALKEDKHSTLFITLLHFRGLPIAENTLTQIFSCPDEYEFLANGTTFKLSKNKVTDITITNDVEIQKNNVSSIGGSVGGAILFGSLGAVIGGRSKEKTSKIVTSYLIFTFLDNDTVKYIAFNCTGDFKASKFIKEFKEHNKNATTTINL